MENLTLKQKMINVFRRYGYYMLLGLFLLALLLTIVFVGVNAKQDPFGDENDVPVNSTVSAYMPVLNATIYKGYYGDELIYNETLKQWETHNGIDFQVANGSKVYSILDGEVVDVYSNLLEGNVVVIEHEGGLTSCYGSLDDSVTVNVGDTVSRGQEIGSVSTSANSEVDAGAHLHFSMFDNDQKIDPASYLNIETK